MNIRIASTIAAGAGFVAPVCRAQELMRVSYSWSEVLAGTLTPVASPNSVLEPGEGARISFNIFATINGTNAVGQTTAWIPPPPPGFGTVRGVASYIYNFSGDLGAATAAGAWSNRTISPILNAGAFVGNALNGGATIDSLGGGQFLSAGQTADATNPIADAFRGVWTPNSYAARTVNFKGDGGTSAPAGQWNATLVQYGSAYVDPTDPTTEYALYMTKYQLTDFGSGVNIPISPLPGPGGECVVAASAAWLLRRRRGP